jgi:protein-S-isoprenylcysteine O-methyltransferase Ste14
MKSKLIDPSWFNLFIPISIVMHVIFPIKILIHSPLKFLGIVFILSGLMLNLAATNHLKHNQTPVGFNQSPNRLVTDGPFGFSRNPIYLGGVAVLLGVATLLGSLVSFCFPVLLFILLNLIYIPSEEKEMEEKFGIDYVEYKQSVRRWV